jgi:beta-phosphoglucomutase-like phosphatase (HAD superfamily)
MTLSVEADLDAILPRRAQAVLFDVDGTLVDSNSQRVRSWQAACREHGLDISREKYMQVCSWLGTGSSSLSRPPGAQP